MRLILVAGTTRTARIEGISAAGADPDLRVHTPSVDAEILAYGAPVPVPGGPDGRPVPVSPTGCPTPAAVARAARERVGFDLTTLDAGLAAPTAAPTVGLDAAPGRDIRAPTAVPDAAGIERRARAFARDLPADEVVVGETIPGGTTTALGVFRALGHDVPVSSSLPDNPTGRKRRAVETGLSASDLAPDGAAGEPIDALAAVGDPVLAAVLGLVRGAAASGTRVVLGGGTQLLAAAALARAGGVEAPLVLATTSYLAADVPIRAAAADLGVEVVVTDPDLARAGAPLDRYAAGEAKEGAGMGGALALAARADAVSDVPAGTRAVLDRLDRAGGEGTGDPGADGGAGADGDASGGPGADGADRDGGDRRGP
ncbi:MAG: nicotinate-nucleotide--dimethylbenzimidazole phosphoribosyltransferase [Haloferacaceae archaeon]